MKDTEQQEVRSILADLQADIRQRRAALGVSSSLASQDPLMRLREKQVVNPHLPIGWPLMPKGVIAKLTAYAQKFTRRLLRWYINPIVAQQNEYNQAATDLLESVQRTVEGLQQRLDARDAHLSERLDAQEAHLSQRLHAGNADLMQLAGTFEARSALTEAQFEALRLRLQRLESWRRSSETLAPTSSAALPSASSSALAQVEGPQVAASIDYYLLGALFRNQVQMGGTLADYDDLWLALAQAQGAGVTAALPVLDLGCGRGEVVAHLRELGLSAYGVDLDPDALRVGQEAGLDLRHSDATAHLESVPDNSLAAVVMIQVVEHFTPDALLCLFRLIEHKLAPGGFVVAETINPACLFALSNWYLMDPSHRTPVHSETARFLMSQAGLERIEIRFLHPVPEGGRLLRLSTEGAPQEPAWATLLSQLQHNFDRLNHVLYGPQDYGAIAYKEAAAEEGRG